MMILELIANHPFEPDALASAARQHLMQMRDRMETHGYQHEIGSMSRPGPNCFLGASGAVISAAERHCGLTVQDIAAGEYALQVIRPLMPLAEGVPRSSAFGEWNLRAVGMTLPEALAILTTAIASIQADPEPQVQADVQQVVPA